MFAFNEFTLSEECAGRKIGYTLLLDGQRHDGSVIAIQSSPGQPTQITAEVAPAQDISLNQVYLFELVGHLSSSSNKTAFLQVCITDGSAECLPTFGTGEQTETACVIARPSDPGALPVEIEYLLNGS